MKIALTVRREPETQSLLSELRADPRRLREGRDEVAGSVIGAACLRC